jgi:hypothetical protein
VERILTDSPWSRPLSARFEFGTGAPVPTEVYLTVRWASALPVRRAEALDRFGRDRLDHPQARELLAEPRHSAIEIFGLPARLFPEGVQKLERQIASTARLAHGRESWRPETASIPEHGMYLAVTVRFPRLTALAPEGVADFSAQAGQIPIRQKFRLKDMRYGGELAL